MQSSKSTRTNFSSSATEITYRKLENDGLRQLRSFVEELQSEKNDGDDEEKDSSEKRKSVEMEVESDRRIRSRKHDHRQSAQHLKSYS